MLELVFDGIEFSPTGIMQAWGGVYSAFKGDLQNQIVNLRTGETIVYSALHGIGNTGYDGGLFVVKSGANIFIFIGPASGKDDYAAWAVIGVHAVASAVARAWVNTLWSSFLLDMYSPVMNVVRPLLTPQSKIQIVGFSNGGAFAQMFARQIHQEGLPQFVFPVGFGAPRAVMTPLLASATVFPFRFVVNGDPVDLVPPRNTFSLDGNTFPGIAMPTAWADYGERYVFPGTGQLVPQVDLPWPGDVAFLASLPFAILNHKPAAYSDLIGQYFLLQLQAGDGSQGGVDAWNLTRHLLLGTPIIAPPADVVFAPQIPKLPEAPPLPLALPQQIQPPVISYITPFIEPTRGPMQFRLPAGIGVDPH